MTKPSGAIERRSIMITNKEAIEYLRKQKAKLEEEREKAIEDLATEMERTAQKFIGSAKMIRKYRRDRVDENLIKQNTMWVEDGIKNINKISEKLEVLEALNWFEDEEEKA